ncbi:hypothetical protein [Chromobacterium haemolyticum]|uniref:hypothetical protein n=1 Tax=Chromobacterium TaxID=535 RepID=UPI00193B8C93
MSEVENILISLDSRHAQNIYAGTKKVELRRRAFHVKAGDIVWIYEKVPVGAITGSASIVAVHVSSPTKLWHQFGSVSGLSKVEFFKYFWGLKTACAIELVEARKLTVPLPLATLRSVIENFQPPQFFLRLGSKKPILSALQNLSQSKNGCVFQPSACHHQASNWEIRKSIHMD